MSEETISITGGPNRTVLLQQVFERNPGLVTFLTGEREENAHLIYMKIRCIETMENGASLKLYGSVKMIDNVPENSPEFCMVYSPEEQLGELGVEEKEEEEERKESILLKVQFGRRD